MYYTGNRVDICLCRAETVAGRVVKPFKETGNSRYILVFLSSLFQKEILNVAIIGQSLFAAEVYKNVKNNGHKIVGVFTIPDQGVKEDPLGNWIFFF